MPKRKRNKDEISYLSDQLKQLKKKIKRVRKHKDSTSSSDSSTEKTDYNHNSEDNLLKKLMAGPTIDEANLPVESATPTDIDDITNATDKDQLTNEIQTIEVQEISLDKEVLEILGDDPANKDEYSQEIHKELASRLQHITVCGLTKEARKELQQRYPLPANAILLGAPTINPEIKATLPETLSNRDKAIEAKQKLLSSAISCIASAASLMLGSNEKNNELLKKLIDANKILCDIQHSDSITRRMFSTSVLKKDVKSQILNSKIDKLLFGENLPETLKTAKAVSKSSAEIKNTFNNNKKQQPGTSKNLHLNVKAPAGPPRRPPVTPQRTPRTVNPRNQPNKSSRTSSHPQWKINNSRRS